MDLLMKEDRRDVHKEEKPFTYKVLKDDKIFVYRENKMIKCISGKKAIEFLGVINSRDDYAIQLYLAKATGNFKHGNER